MPRFWRITLLSAGMAAIISIARAQTTENDPLAVDQIAPDTKASSAVEQAPGDREDASVIDQSPPGAEDICDPANAARRRALGVSCLDDDRLLLPDGEEVARDEFELREYGAYLRLDPAEGRSRGEIEEILDGAAD